MLLAEVTGENTPEGKFASIGSRTQPPGHEADTLTTEPPGRGDNGRIQSGYNNGTKTMYLDFRAAFILECALLSTIPKFCGLAVLTLAQTTNFRLFQNERHCRRQF